MGGRSKRCSKAHSEELRDIQQLYLSPEQLATGLGARWYGERTAPEPPATDWAAQRAKVEICLAPTLVT